MGSEVLELPTLGLSLRSITLQNEFTIMGSLITAKDNYDIPAYVNRVAIAPSGACVYKDFWITKRKRQSETEDVAYPTTENKDRNKEDKPELPLHERLKNHGIMSEYSRRKMKKSIEWLNFAANEKRMKYRKSGRTIKMRLAFVTLTLPSSQRHSDQIIKRKCLNYLLIELRKFHGLRNYIWRAEKQINGNIHFHLVCDSFLDADMLRRRWNRIVNTLGYVDEYQKKMKASIHDFSDYVKLYHKTGSYMDLKRRYHAGKSSEWSNPNSTDVHSTRKIRNMVAYLMKYMCKNVESPELLSDEDRKRLLVDGQIWGLSESLTRMRNISFCEYDNEMFEFGWIWHNENYFNLKDEFFEFKSIPIQRYFKGDCPLLAKLVTKVIQETLNPFFTQGEIT